jgi:hypothetical protein
MDDLQKVKQHLITARNAANGGDTSSAEMYIPPRPESWTNSSSSPSYQRPAS